MDTRNEMDSRGAREPVVDIAAEELADRREEWKRYYEWVPVKATAGQLRYIRIMLKDAWLDKSDFRSSLEFYRKGRMSHSRADELIKLGKKRMDEERRRKAHQVPLPKWMTE